MNGHPARGLVQEQMKGPPVRIDVAQSEALLQQFFETSDIRKSFLMAVSIMSQHVHIVVGVPGDPDPERILNDFKRYASQRLNRSWTTPKSGRWWTRRALDDASSRQSRHRSGIRNWCPVEESNRRRRAERRQSPDPREHAAWNNRRTDVLPLALPVCGINPGERSDVSRPIQRVFQAERGHHPPSLQNGPGRYSILNRRAACRQELAPIESVAQAGHR